MTTDKKQKKPAKCNRARRKSDGKTRLLPRTVHIGKEVWSYSVRQSRVSIRCPEGLVRTFNKTLITGDVLADDYNAGPILPKDVKEFIMDRFGGTSGSFKHTTK